MIGTIGGAAMTPTTTSSKCAKYNLENWERRYDKLNSDMKETSAKSNDLQNEITRATEELNRVKTQIAESNQRDTKSDSETKNELKEKEKAAIEKLNETAEKGKLEIIELQRKITNAHSEMQKSSSQYEASLALFTKAQKERACIKQIRDRLATLKGSTTGNVGGAISGAKYTKSELQSDYQICMINLDSQHLAQIQNWEGRKLDFAKQMEVLEEQKATLDKTIRNLPVDIAKAQAQTNDLNAQLTQQAIQRSKNNYNQLVGANQVFDQTKQALAIKQADYAKQLNALSNQAMSLGPKPDSDTKATSGEAVSEMGALLSQTKSIQACCAKSSSTFCNDFKKTSENIDEDSPFMELKDLQYDLDPPSKKAIKSNRPQLRGFFGIECL
jgi:chromosome segregation ATPase